MREVKLTLPRPHAAQMEILRESKRFNVLACGRRFGKTTLGGNLLQEPCLQMGRSAAWFAPTYRLLEEAYNDHKRIYGPVVVRSVQSPAPRIELINGSAIDYWTLDDPTTVARGRKYARVIVDEAAMARNLEEAWTEAIRPTLTDYRGGAYFLSTPKGSNFFKVLYDHAENDEEWARWQMPTTSNPYIAVEEVEAARLSMPSIAFRQEFLAEFVETSGARIRRDWMRVGPVPAGLPVFLGVDLAITTKTESDYTCAVAICIGPDGTVYVKDAVRIRAPFEGILQFVKNMAAKHKPRAIGIEKVAFQAAAIQELMRTTRLPVRGLMPTKDKVTRFGPLEARYEQGLICHAPDLPAWFTDEILSFPVGMHDDAVDAFGYAWQTSGYRPLNAV